MAIPIMGTAARRLDGIPGPALQPRQPVLISRSRQPGFLLNPPARNKLLPLALHGVEGYEKLAKRMTLTLSMTPTRALMNTKGINNKQGGQVFTPGWHRPWRC
jgi:hypothetical protein